VNFSAVAKGLKVDCIVTRYYEIVCQIAVKTLSRSCISSFVIQFNTYFVCQIAVKTLSRSCMSDCCENLVKVLYFQLCDPI
jgi:hypothetical protein